MKVLALVVLTVASVSSLGSGPYLPSGWRPQGPAFYLPSEVQKPSENPLKDAILNESEASSSDALREYGPPKVVEVSQDLTRQVLPETVTDQAFVVIQAKFSEEENREVKELGEVRAIEEAKADVTEAVVDAVEVTTEQDTIEVATEVIEDKTTEAEQIAPQGRAIDVQTIEETVEVQDTATGKAIVETTEVKTAEDSNVESTQVEQVSQEQEVSQAEVKTEGVQNILEELNNLEQEIKAQQVETTKEAVGVKSVEVAGSEPQGPEGFLEYGPPGFREYGPPQAEDFVRSGAIVQETTEEQKIENNETRRRRFSPKFRFSRNSRKN